MFLGVRGAGTVGNRYTHGPGVDEPLALSNNKGNYYYHADGLGSVVALTDVTQTVVQDYQYGFFGDLKDQKNRIKQPYRYTGREWDKETGLYFYRARYYDATVGRFTQKDPIGLRGGINLYNYVGGNPINWTDPWGLFSEQQCSIVEDSVYNRCLEDAASWGDPLDTMLCASAIAGLGVLCSPGGLGAIAAGASVGALTCLVDVKVVMIGDSCAKHAKREYDACLFGTVQGWKPAGRD